MGTKTFQVIFSSYTEKEITKIQEALREIGEDIDFEDTTRKILTYAVSIESLSKTHKRFFDRYFEDKKEILEYILKQFFQTACESDSMI